MFRRSSRKTALSQARATPPQNMSVSQPRGIVKGENDEYAAQTGETLKI